MAVNHLPPQAYTKETLSKAFAWLMNQNDNIKEIAKTPDILISLYLKAQRHGEDYLERPSLQSFKNELKSIAGLMGDFENQPLQPTQQSIYFEAPQVAPQVAQQNPPIDQKIQLNSIFTKQQEPTKTPTQNQPDLISQLDSESQKMIQEVKNLFNFGSESETLRFMISLAHKKAQKLNADI